MIINTQPITHIEIKKLSDLATYKKFMDYNNLKINKSQIARDLGKDPRTIDKYLNGFNKSKTRKRKSKLDKYHDLISELLSSQTQKFYYVRVLYQYLKDNHGLKVPEITFRNYINSHKEFNDYFKKDRKSNARDLPVIRFETGKGKQAQLDWKESIEFVLKDTGEVIKVNVFVLLMSYSRNRVYRLSIPKTREILIDHLTNAFEALGGVPEEILTDNMSTIMDEGRTLYNEGKLNKEFGAFSKDMGFKLKACVVASPQTKAKVESPMKILDELRAYSGTLTYVELNDKLEEINSRVNCSINKGTGKIPIEEFEKEKGFLNPLPQEAIRNQYKIKTIEVSVNTASMIRYNNNQYSVPPKYLNKKVRYQVYDSKIYVYFNTKLIAVHDISDKKINYDEGHYIEILKANFKNKDEDAIKEMAKENLRLIGEVYESNK